MKPDLVTNTPEDSATHEARRGADEWGGGYWSACEGLVDLEQVAREEADDDYWLGRERHEEWWR